MSETNIRVEQAWERDERVDNFPEFREEADYQNEQYRKYGHKRRPTDKEEGWTDTETEK